MTSYQSRVKPCFGPQIAIDKVERNHRFIEEALELIQATGITQEEVYELVDYVFNAKQKAARIERAIEAKEPT